MGCFSSTRAARAVMWRGLPAVLEPLGSSDIDAEGGEHVDDVTFPLGTDDATPSQIVEAHDRSIQKLTRSETFRSEPLPGVDDGAYSTFDGLGWALLPGWDLPRQVTWKEGFCGDQLPAKLKAIADAPQPPTARPFFREALIPAARPSAAAPAAAPSPPRGATGDIEAG